MTTEYEERGGSTTGILIAFVAGAAVGAATALLFAPASGVETRRRVKGAALDAAETAKHGVQNLKGTMNDSWQRAVDAAKDAFEAALQRD